MSVKALTFIEIDVDYCDNVYGVTPCTASIPETGAIKCFNCKNTCQDRENYANAPVTLRFAIAADYLPKDIECIPSIRSASVTPAVISLGEDLGTRGSLTVTFADHRWSDTGPGFDKYYAERPYDPFQQGTFFGKFRARQPFLQGKPIRLIRGFLGQALGEMETRAYVIESFDGPTPDGTYTITAKDALKLADGDRARAPALSNGFLVSGIDSDDVSATLSPAGIGDDEYPEEGVAAIGGKEIVTFTRSGDVLTLTARGQHGTDAQSHAAQDRVQIVLIYSGEDPADIIANLFEVYAGIPSGYIPLASWQNETSSYLRRLYTAVIAEPTPVSQLVSELIEQAALAIWWSDIQQLIRLQVLRPIDTTAALYTPDNFLAGSLQSREQPERRLSQVWTYFAQRNPLDGLDDPNNYRSTAATVDLEAEDNYGVPAIKTIYSRWIPEGGRTVATRLNDIQLGRFRDPPRRFNLSLLRGQDQGVMLGGGYRLQAWPLQDATGAPAEVPLQVTRLNPKADTFDVEAEEMLFKTFDEEDANNRTIIIDANTLNKNIRTIHDTLYPEPLGTETVICIVEAGVIVGSASLALPALDTGDWPTGVALNLTLLGRIQGRGGDGGDGAWADDPGTPGGTKQGNPGHPGGAALLVRYPVNLTCDTGEIWGGGGGGYGVEGSPSAYSSAGGGGGAGQTPGSGGAAWTNPGGIGTTGHAGSAGTTEAGGAAGYVEANASHTNIGDAGAGGDPGEDADPPGAGWAFDPPGVAMAGPAILGEDDITFVGSEGDIRGPREDGGIGTITKSVADTPTPQTANQSTYTFTSAALGSTATDRLIVVSVQAMTTSNTLPRLTGVSIAGNDAELFVTAHGRTSIQQNAITGMAYLRVPTGTTGNIVVTFTAAVANCKIVVHRLTGQVHDAPADFNARILGGADISCVIAVPEAGVAIGSAVDPVGNTLSWTGLTLDNGAVVESAGYGAAASAAFASAVQNLTVTVSRPTSTRYAVLVAASWR